MGGTTHLSWAVSAGVYEVLQYWLSQEASKAALLSVLHTHDKSNSPKMDPFAAACDMR